jgi:hypothetical protein
VGWFTRLFDRIDDRLDRPADQSVLHRSHREGSERVLDSDDPDLQKRAAAEVRRRRTGSTSRWLNR